MMKTINDYFPLIKSGEMTAEQATQDCIDRGFTYALEFFSPQCKSELPYWDMIKTNAYAKFFRKDKIAQNAVNVDTVRCDCGCDVPRHLRMSASLGISCPDCYDDMSD